MGEWGIRKDLGNARGSGYGKDQAEKLIGYYAVGYKNMMDARMMKVSTY